MLYLFCSICDTKIPSTDVSVIRIPPLLANLFAQDIDICETCMPLFRQILLYAEEVIRTQSSLIQKKLVDSESLEFFLYCNICDCKVRNTDVKVLRVASPLWNILPTDIDVCETCDPLMQKILAHAEEVVCARSALVQQDAMADVPEPFATCMVCQCKVRSAEIRVIHVPSPLWHLFFAEIAVCQECAQPFQHMITCADQTIREGVVRDRTTANDSESP